MSLTLVDSTTREVHAFALEKSGKVTIQDFFISVEDKLSAAMAKPEKCVRILSVAVGDNRINMCDQRRTVHYYLLDAKPWYIQTAMFNSNHADLCIQDVNGEYSTNAIIKADLNGENVKDLKLKFSKMTCRTASALHLIYEDKELEEGQKLTHYQLRTGSLILCIYGSSKPSLRTPYVYISQQDGRDSKADQPIGSAGANSSPVWRRATPGMWLEGVCLNQICPAFSKMVVMNQGYTDLDIIAEMHSCKCPICYTVITPVLCGFNKCRWMSVGQKKEVSGTHKSPEIVRQDWQGVHESWPSICPDITTWSNLKITSKKLNSVDFCVLCMSDLVSDLATASCGHVFHGSCLRKASSACLKCCGNQTMTSYQQLYN